ncbi:GntR family transcriptional regulator [Garciella nitratireducens]|uniref:GntR family transcriptional regulator n=1 Tax=Garciella nitratireducens TaxID=218205 RepID=UPI000DE8D9E3|nr:GntR family transcriptional regulator [Garciella nitratireducens]RBP46971.1 GntR family transcriptional regulator [Garciella nitratireducens]
MRIEKKNGIPIYVQVKEYILEEIKKGILKIGDKLPTERELSQKLHVSRNTISTAYDLLEEEGVLVSYQGKGTFVAQEDKTWKQEREKTKVIQLVDIALEEAIEMGLSTKEFIVLVQERVKEKEEFIKNINAVFVECNREQAKLFSEQINKNFNLRVNPAILDDLKDGASQNNTIRNANLIITPFNHVNEVKNRLGYAKKEVIGIGTNPNLATIVKIAKYPKGTRFGQISLSKEFQFKVQYTLKSAGLEDIIIHATTSDKEEELLKIIDCSDVVIVSPSRATQVKKLIGDKKEMIRFDYVLDQEAIKTLLSKIIELKSNL